MNIIESYQPQFLKAIDFFKKDLMNLRTGRATSNLVENILVEAYGVKTPLQQLASITVPEPRLIIIQPWDRNIIKEIEKSLLTADLGAAPSIKEGVIHLNLPPLNEESRQRLVKILNEKLENAKRAIRAIRDEVREKIIESEREKEITEDDKYRLLEELDKKSGQHQEEVKEIAKKKEGDIMTV